MANLVQRLKQTHNLLSTGNEILQDLRKEAQDLEEKEGKTKKLEEHVESDHDFSKNTLMELVNEQFTEVKEEEDEIQKSKKVLDIIAQGLKELDQDEEGIREQEEQTENELRAIKQKIQRMKQEGVTDEAVREVLEMIEDSAKKLRTELEEMLDTAEDLTEIVELEEETSVIIGHEKTELNREEKLTKEAEHEAQESHSKAMMEKENQLEEQEKTEEAQIETEIQEEESEISKTAEEIEHLKAEIQAARDEASKLNRETRMLEQRVEDIYSRDLQKELNQIRNLTRRVNTKGDKALNQISKAEKELNTVDSNLTS